ncbi:YeeE/YedE family protein [Citrobacter sp. JGM124]|nr:YeeE/YedE family protein [Citrobacter sp. JGM124]
MKFNGDCVNEKLMSIIVALVSVIFIFWLGHAIGLKWALMGTIGFGLGFTLSFSRFGIVFGWREMISRRSSYYVRIHLLTILIEILLFTTLLSFTHAIFGGKMVGNIMAISVPFVVWAFVFGIGMQLAGACASGTLYCCGEGRPLFWIVLVFYGVGTLISNAFKPELTAIFPGVAITAKDITGNLWSGMLLNILLVAALYFLFSYLEFKKTGNISHIFTRRHVFWKDGRFTVLTGGILIAVLNSTVVALHGSAWTVTGAIYESALRVASLFGLFGDDPRLAKPLFLNPMVGMFVAGLLGAAFSRYLTGKHPSSPASAGRICASVLGGLLMGLGGAYAACNLGGFFDGTASGSLHGWIWMVMALGGSVIGIRLRHAINV